MGAFVLKVSKHPRIAVPYCFAADCDIVQDFGPTVLSNCALFLGFKSSNPHSSVARPESFGSGRFLVAAPARVALKVRNGRHLGSRLFLMNIRLFTVEMHDDQEEEGSASHQGGKEPIVASPG